MRELPLTRGQVALLDDDDWDRVVAVGRWQALPHHSSGHYAFRKGVYLHCFVMGRSRVDHINGNKLDCRKSNLRPATQAQNSRNAGLRKDNSTGYKGVFCKVGKRGVERFHTHVAGRYRGSFSTAVAAAVEYNIQAIREFGEFARLNPVFSGEVP